MHKKFATLQWCRDITRDETMLEGQKVRVIVEDNSVVVGYNGETYWAQWNGQEIAADCESFDDAVEMAKEELLFVTKAVNLC